MKRKTGPRRLTLAKDGENFDPKRHR